VAGPALTAERAPVLTGSRGLAGSEGGASNFASVETSFHRGTAGVSTGAGLGGVGTNGLGAVSFTTFWRWSDSSTGKAGLTTFTGTTGCACGNVTIVCGAMIATAS
jgi:hypothetical protein